MRERARLYYDGLTARRAAQLAEKSAAPDIDEERLARAIADHGDICSRMAIPECAAKIAAAYRDLR